MNNKKILDLRAGKKLVTSALLVFAGWQGSVSAEDSNLLVLDWSGYEDPGFFSDYVAKYDGAPDYSYFADEEEAFTKLRSGFQADLAHPCVGSVRKWADAGLIQPLDLDRLKGWDKVLPSIKSIPGITMDGKVWMLPFDWGRTGLIYRTDMISDDAISLDLATKPEFEGKVSIPDIVTGAYAMAAVAIGMRDWSNMTDEQFQQASDYLRKVHKNVRFYWSDPGQLDQALASGEVAMGWGWNQTTLNLETNKTPAAMMLDTDKGVSSWVCGYVHLTGGNVSKDKVYDMLNALGDPKSGKYLIESWGYAHANSDAYTLANPEMVHKYGYEDASNFISQSLVSAALPVEIERKMVKEFERIKSGL